MSPFRKISLHFLECSTISTARMGIFAGPSYRQIGNHPAENLGDVLIKKGVRTNVSI